MHAISMGEVLWDVIGAAEHLGGAAFNFALHLQNLGHTVDFLSAVGDDERGRRVLHRMQQAGLSTEFVAQSAHYPTGTASVGLDQNGHPHFVIKHPAAYDFPKFSDEDAVRLCSDRPELIYFGTLSQMSPPARAITLQVLSSCPSTRRFYDANLRPDGYTPELVLDLMSKATVVKVNDDEVRVIRSMFSETDTSPEQFCRDYARRFGWDAVCVTRGAEGCVLLLDSTLVTSPGYKVPVVDTIGAGDAFAAALAHGIMARWSAATIADFANRVGALVASRAGATPSWTLAEAASLGG